MSDKLEFRGLTFSREKDGLLVTHRGVAGSRYHLGPEETRSLMRFLNRGCGYVDDRRRDFRVAVTGLSGLDVYLLRDDRDIHVIPVDISYTGIQVRFGSASPGNIATRSAVTLRLEYAGDSVTLPGEVCRMTGNSVGIFFTNSCKHETLDPPAGLVDIISGLQNSRA